MKLTSHTHSNTRVLACVIELHYITDMSVSLFEQACLYVRVFVSGHIRTRLDLASGSLTPGMDGASLAKERKPRLWPAGLKRPSAKACHFHPIIGPSLSPLCLKTL